MKWRGRKLNHPLVILIRLTLYPVLWLLQLLLCLVVLLGWGRDEAVDVWKHLS